MNIVPSSKRNTHWQNKAHADRERLNSSLNAQLLHKSVDENSGAISVVLNDVMPMLKDKILNELPDAGYVVMHHVYENDRLVMQILPI